MGFPSITYSIILPMHLAIPAYFFDRVRVAILIFSAYIGLCSPVEEQDFVYVELDFSVLPSLSNESPSSIKKRLPVVEFADFCRESAASGCGEEAECAVCMGELEARHEVRELGNCSHAFHMECIDKWVDVGQTTCPLCRAHLLPKESDGAVVLTKSNTRPTNFSLLRVYQ